MSTANLIRDFKKDFPLLQAREVAYLDNSATSQRPLAVLQAERDFYLQHNANPLRGLYALAVEATQAYEAARSRVARFINAASPEEVIFTRNATESLNLLAYSWARNNLGPGTEVLGTIMEHHSNLLPWRSACQATGAAFRYLDCDAQGRIAPKDIEAAIGPQTKLVAVTVVSNVLGCRNPVEKLIQKAHQVGALVVLDAAQSIPHLPLDVQALGADFAAFSGHKLLGPMGIGVLYGKKALLQNLPPFLQGGEMIEWVSRDSCAYAPLPHRFEAGTVNAAAAVGLAAAMDYLEEVGYDAIKEREDDLTALLYHGLTALPHVQVLGSQVAEEHHGIIAFTVDDVHPHDIAAILDADGVAIRAGHHCAQPLLEHLGVASAARASLAFYNDAEDVERFLTSVSSLRKRMGYGR